MEIIDVFKRIKTKKICSLDSRIKLIFITTFVSGLIAHGVMFFNKYSYHDDIALLYGTVDGDIYRQISFGRWTGALLFWILEKVFIHDYSLPLFKGIVMLFFIAVFWIMISKWLKINDYLSIGMISMILTVCTTVTACLGYMFSAYSIGLHWILAFIGCRIFMQKQTFFRTLIAVIVCVFTLGLYQANFICIITILSFGILVDVLNEDVLSANTFIKKSLCFICFAGISLVGYLFTNKVILRVTGIQASNYYGLDSMANVNILEYVKKLPQTFVTFFNPNLNTYSEPYPGNVLLLYQFIMVLLVLLIIVTARLLYQKNGSLRVMQFVAIIMVIPIAIEFLIVVSPSVYVHSMYSHNFSYILVLVLIEKCLGELDKSIFLKHIRNAFLVLVMLINVCFIQYDNACYLKANLLQTHAISYFNDLITRIEMIEGYSDNMPVFFIEPRRKRPIDLINEMLNSVTIEPYGNDSLVNDYMWLGFMREWCNFKNPVIQDPTGYFEQSEIQNMSIYPNDGSLKIINNCIVVKFNEMGEE